MTGDGETARAHDIAGVSLRARILDRGAILQDLRLDGHEAPLVLGYERFEDYLADEAYFGATVGRYANRIAEGRFQIDGERYRLDANFGRHMLHGGSDGYSRRPWRLHDSGVDFVTLALTDPDGAMGFPGTLEVFCTYRIKPPATLALEFVATCDAPTLVNLTHHSYFNLDDGGAGDILDHRLMLPASAYLPVDRDLIPTGHVVPVADTPFDFRRARPIRMEQDGGQLAYDHNFCLAAARADPRQAAWLQAGRSGVEMEVWTTEPGIQLFTGHILAVDGQGLGGASYRPFSGLCLEPQTWPDSPNFPYFPQAVLRPGETYRHVTEYRFRTA